MNPFKKYKNNINQQALILDTCALIDGRIVAIVKAGFVPQTIIIPHFIVAELQFLADKGDSHKRERARYGLDVIRELQELRQDGVTIAREQFKHIKEVDDKLIALAKQYGSGAQLYTTDYNLNKVAQIEGVTVLNVNELAQALRPLWLPGERAEIKVIQVGQDTRQGVGYLEDGTMVVVEEGGNKVGQRILVECKRMLQTQAGKMMFATIVANQKPQHPPKEPRHQPNEPKPTIRPVAQANPKERPIHQKTKHKMHSAPHAQQPRPQRRKLNPEESLLKALDQSR